MKTLKKNITKMHIDFFLLLGIACIGVVLISYVRIFIIQNYSVFIAGECLSDICLEYEGESYGIIQKDVKDTVQCTDEDCLGDVTCLDDNSCTYIDCTSNINMNYLLAHSCN